MMTRSLNRRVIRTSVLALVAGLATHSLAGEIAPPASTTAAAPGAQAQADVSRILYKTTIVDGVKIFYREAGPADAPTILLLHGFPSSSHMFRNLIPALADRYHVIAPDYPGFGQSDSPDRATFAYTFDHLAQIVDTFTQQVGLSKFAIYVQDYGAPIGYRIASAHPERITGLIVQNGNAYVEGLPDDFWKPIKDYWADRTPENRAALEKVLTLDATKWQYTVGVRDVKHISPDAWTVDQAGLDRPGNKDIQLDLFLDYGSNPPKYPAWQEYFRNYQPPTLIVWGKNDPIFPPAGAEPYKRDLKNVDFNLLDTGHFALEEDGALIAGKIRSFMERNVRPTK